MSRDLSLLEQPFREKVVDLLKRCEDDGYTMRPFFTLRSVYRQAELWRQSRPTWQIKKKVAELREIGAPFLADVIMEVGPQNGKWATNALPGMSWHQHGKAVDCFWLVDDDAEWSETRKKNGRNGYEVYAQHAKDMGLEAGFFWSKKYKDAVHVQETADSIPRMIRDGELTYPELDERMREKFT